MTEPQRLGLMSYGICLPPGFETAEMISARSGLSPQQLILEWGVEKKCLPGPQDQPVSMAVKAAREALRRAGNFRPEEIDVVIWTGEEYKDFIAQTASIRIQEEVGAYQAWAFDLIGQGVTSLVGLRIAQDLMFGDPSVRTVLLAGGTRNLDLVDCTNPHTRWMLAASASGTAMVLRRGHPQNRLLATAFLVDPELADEVYVPGGGTVHPFGLETLSPEMTHFQVKHPKDLSKYFSSRMPGRLIEVVQKTMAQAGFPGEAPDYLALRHLPPRERRQVIAALGIREENSDTLSDVGHHGPNDVILSLDRAIQRGVVRAGSKVVLAAAGIGFTYAAALIQWGPS
jgi:3-oxoacyl-[acyl-carrier-protein] synthase-3